MVDAGWDARFEAVWGTAPRPGGEVIGRSREGRELVGLRVGRGPKVSLIAGSHADEPVGPRFLGRLATYLSELPAGDPLLHSAEWWIVPHVNPDGAARNRPWCEVDVECFDFGRYLAHARREPPGDDVEFGFPRDAQDTSARPETQALAHWWAGDPSPFALHLSFHGMALAGGPWFLLEPGWLERDQDGRLIPRPALRRLMDACARRSAELGYALHDVQRNGEKGFHRIERGFCTRPDHRAMQAFFRDRGDERTAALFRPNSMEHIRDRGGDPLTLVSEVPLFVIPGVGENLGPPDPVAREWKRKVSAWQLGMDKGGTAPETVSRQAVADGIRPVPIEDQMRLQWTLLGAGLRAVGILGSE